MEGEGGDEVQGHNELRLRHALDPRTRRWARAEFFCSALDRPWLANNGVQQLCNHFGLKKGQLARLSRTEWTCIRRSLGRPRRLSLAFLRQVYNQSIHQYVFNVLGANWDPTDKKFSSVNSYKQNFLHAKHSLRKPPHVFGSQYALALQCAHPSHMPMLKTNPSSNYPFRRGLLKY